jgi:hypothetical protein
MRRGPSIPLSSATSLSRGASWTLLVRAALAMMLVAGLVAAFLLTRDHPRANSFLESGRSPVIALDLSWSVSYANSKLIEQTLRDFADSGRRLGLVLFSDTAYQALPVGTSSDALRPFLRFFSGSGPNPWAATFSAGTRISSALDRARSMLRQARVDNGSVVLISDLDDAPNDEVDLARSLVDYQRDQIPIRMIAVNPVPQDAQFFRDALGSGGSVTTLRSVRAIDAGGRSFPTLLVVLIALVVLLLALNEHLLGRLVWTRRRRTA